MTRRFAVVGDPVAHSLSPFIHGRWIAEAKLDGTYDRIHLQSDHAAQDIRKLASEGWSGLNITLPHKLAALEAASEVSDEAKLVGAANTLALKDGGWSAHNTDVEGFAWALRLATKGGDYFRRPVLVIGAGGAARAVMVHLARLGANITIANRTPANAIALRDAFAPDAVVSTMEAITHNAAQVDLVINTASLGHSGAALPALPRGKGLPFLDISYGKAAAPVLAAARDSGWAAHDGLPMLVGQAAAAFRIWWGVEPDVEGALKACREKVGA